MPSILWSGPIHSFGARNILSSENIARIVNTIKIIEILIKQIRSSEMYEQVINIEVFD